MRAVFCVTLALALLAARALEPTCAELLAKDATAFLNSLSATEKAIATVPATGPERTAWSFVPGDRPGIRLDALTEPQRALALAMMRRGLSDLGWKTIEGVFALDGLLGKAQPDRYNALWYDVLVLGDPASPPWGVRLEGHHLSLQWMTDGTSISVTPMFVGAAPFTVKGGALDGFAPLGRERELAFVLWGLLTPEQRAKARIGPDAPGDIVGVPGGANRLKDPVGIEAMHMTRQQRDALWALIRVASNRLAAPLDAAEVARWRAASMDAVRFAWMGGDDPTQRHYFRITGGDFAMEFDCTTGVDHVHWAWHDFTHDHGDAFFAHAKEHADGTTHGAAAVGHH